MDNNEFKLRVEVDEVNRPIVDNIIRECSGNIEHSQLISVIPYQVAQLVLSFKDKGHQEYCKLLLEQRANDVTMLNKIWYNSDQTKIKQKKKIDNIDNLMKKLRDYRG